MAPVAAKRTYDEASFTHKLAEAAELQPGVADVAYEDELEKLDSELQLAWNKSLEPAFLAKATAYDRVEVLMLSWEADHDDLNVKPEMDELEHVFRDIYKFNTTRQRIVNHAKRTKRPQAQVNAFVANWVLEHEAEKTLLIVYFAGHGEPGDKSTPGKLVLDGRQGSRYDINRYQNTVDWDRTEHNLLNIGSDVLQIFDCCFAAAANGNRGGLSQICEYLAACDENGRTKRPGKHSFTTALIWALKELKEQRFTTVQLITKINQAPDFPKAQVPKLLKRRHNPNLHDNERLVLHPLIDRLKHRSSFEKAADGEGAENGDAEHKRKKRKQNEFKQDVVTLKLVFESRPPAADIGKLAEGLGHLVQGRGLDISNIVWGGLRPRESGMSVWSNPKFFQAISRFKSLIQKADNSDAEGFVEEVQEILSEGAKEIDQHLPKKVKMAMGLE